MLPGRGPGRQPRSFPFVPDLLFLVFRAYSYRLSTPKEIPYEPFDSNLIVLMQR